MYSEKKIYVLRFFYENIKSNRKLSFYLLLESSKCIVKFKIFEHRLIHHLAFYWKIITPISRYNKTTVAKIWKFLYQWILITNDTIVGPVLCKLRNLMNRTNSWSNNIKGRVKIYDVQIQARPTARYVIQCNNAQKL